MVSASMGLPVCSILTMDLAKPLPAMLITSRPILDDEAVVYFMLANKLAHEINPHVLSIAEEMSGLPGLAAPLSNGGLGFDYRMSMGVPDLWIKLIKEKQDQEWDVGHLFYELTTHRPEEKVVSYVESHDQAMVGDKTDNIQAD